MRLEFGASAARARRPVAATSELSCSEEVVGKLKQITNCRNVHSR
jgi:hypothetical protein